MKFIIRDDRIRHNCISHISEMSVITPKLVVITDYVEKRSLDQNAFLHAVPLKLLCEHTGFTLDEMKDYLLGEAFGWRESKIVDRVVTTPLRRTSDLNRREFSWFIEWIEMWASETLGLRIPRPNEELD